MAVLANQPFACFFSFLAPFFAFLVFIPTENKRANAPAFRQTNIFFVSLNCGDSDGKNVPADTWGQSRNWFPLRFSVQAHDGGAIMGPPVRWFQSSGMFQDAE